MRIEEVSNDLGNHSRVNSLEDGKKCDDPGTHLEQA
jgi:hypothetical protein